MVRCCSKTNELRDIDSIRLRSKNGKLTISKSKSSPLALILIETISFENDKFKSKDASLVSEVLALLS